MNFYNTQKDFLKLKSTLKNYELAGNMSLRFERCNKNISLTVYDEKG